MAVEILVGTTALGNLIREGKTYQIPSLIQTGRREGMQTMDQAILELLRSKQITPQEAYRKAVDKEIIAGTWKGCKVATIDWMANDRYKRRHLPDGATLCHEGDFGDTIYFVVPGGVQISKR